MASQGPNSSGTITDDSSTGSVAWTNVTNVGASDNSYATATVTGIDTADPRTHYINCQNFGFSVPAGATIDGIQVDFEWKATGYSSSPATAAFLIKGGAIGGSGKTPSISTVEQYVTAGSSSDLWGNTLSSSDVNASNFGVVVRITSNDFSPGTVSISVDHIRMTVYYTAASGKLFRTSPLSGIGAGGPFMVNPLN